MFRGLLNNETVAVKVFPSVDANSWIVEQVRCVFLEFLERFSTTAHNLVSLGYICKTSSAQNTLFRNILEFLKNTL